MSPLVVPLTDIELAEIEAVLGEAHQRARAGEFGPDRGARLLVVGSEEALRELLGWLIVDSGAAITAVLVRAVFRIDPKTLSRADLAHGPEVMTMDVQEQSNIDLNGYYGRCPTCH